MDQRAEEETGNYLVCVELLNLCFPAAVSMDFILHRQLFVFFCLLCAQWELIMSHNKG